MQQSCNNISKPQSHTIMKTEPLIQQLINNGHSPINFEQIATFLESQNLKPNKTTIYRNLEKLEKDGLIKKVILSDQKQFWEVVHYNSKTHQDHQHYHLICNSCTNIECQELPRIILPKLNFNVQRMEINLFGLCNNCQLN